MLVAAILGGSLNQCPQCHWPVLAQWCVLCTQMHLSASVYLAHLSMISTD